MKTSRIAIAVSSAFHIGLAAALAYQVGNSASVEVLAGRDSVQTVTLTALSSHAEPQLLDSPVVVTTEDVRISERRWIETSTTIPARHQQAAATPDRPDDAVAVVDLARSLTARLETPNVARQTARQPEPPAATNDQPVVPRRAAQLPPPSSAASTVSAQAKELGAEVPKESASRIVPPVFTSARPPVFPSEARRHGWRGVVMLMITVDELGAVKSVDVVETSGHATLDAAAVRAVRTWRGRPATRDGLPYESKWKKPIRFE